MNQLELYYLYTWKYYKETPCVAFYLKQAKMSCFSFFLFSSTKLENRRKEEVLAGGIGTSGKGKVVEKEVG
jgi:hypothetical protein